MRLRGGPLPRTAPQFAYKAFWFAVAIGLEPDADPHALAPAAVDPMAMTPIAAAHPSPDMPARDCAG